MSGLDLRALREAAEAATAEDWMRRWWTTYAPEWIESTTGVVEVATFIAAANPSAMLALLDRLEAAEGAVERARKVIEDRHAGDFAPILPKLAAALDPS